MACKYGRLFAVQKIAGHIAYGVNLGCRCYGLDASWRLDCLYQTSGGD
jgi:hypothetical protein